MTKPRITPATTLDSQIASTVTHGRTVQQWLRQDPRVIQRVGRIVLGVPLRVLTRQRHIGREHIPHAGPVMLCPNHTHDVDFLVQVIGFRRSFRVLGKSELLTHQLLGLPMRISGVFPVVRGGGDSIAVDLASLMLLEGQLLIVYPEGTRCKVPDAMGTPKRGAARLALATGCTIVPSATYGLQRGTGRAHLPRWLRWIPGTTRVTTIYAPPFSVPREDAPTPERIDEVRDEIWSRVVEAFEAARADQLAR